MLVTSFSPFATIFSKAVYLTVEFSRDCVKESESNLQIESILSSLTLSQTSPGFYVSAVQVFLKHSGKRRNCSLRAISPFPTVFSTHLERFLPFFVKFEIVVCKLFQFRRI